MLNLNGTLKRTGLLVLAMSALLALGIAAPGCHHKARPVDACGVAADCGAPAGCAAECAPASVDTGVCLYSGPVCERQL